jgi:hypothetical protein
LDGDGEVEKCAKGLDVFDGKESMMGVTGTQTVPLCVSIERCDSSIAVSKDPKILGDVSGAGDEPMISETFCSPIHIFLIAANQRHKSTSSNICFVIHEAKLDPWPGVLGI